MTQYTKPTVLPAWAETGDKTQPTNAEIQAGWPLSTTPPSRQRFNWILNWCANALRYLMQVGISEWDATEDYPLNARVKLNGTVYRAIIGTANINHSPDVSPTYWKNEAASWYADDTGAVNAYVITPALPPNAYFDGMRVGFSTTNANTTTNPTINVNGLGAITITKPGGAALNVGQLHANTVLELSYNSTGPRFELQSTKPVPYRQIVTVTGNFTTPADITPDTVFKITLIGPGGGGGGSNGVSIAQGGGAGGAATFLLAGLQPSTAYSVTIGAPGVGGAVGNNNGTTGGTTSIVINGVTYSVNGGTFGTGTASAQYQVGPGTQGVVSATITALPSAIVYEQVGNFGLYLASLSYLASAGASLSPWGEGGWNGAAQAGIGFAAGGTGGTAGQGGGNGAPSAVIIEWEV